MIHEKDIDRVNETPAQRAERLAKERYLAAGVQLKQSDAWAKWKGGLTSAQRMYVVAVLLAVVIIAVMLIANYWDVPQAQSPRGEGGVM